LLLDGVLEVALLEGVLLEVSVGSGGGVPTVERDRLAGERAGDPELAPGGDILGKPWFRFFEKMASTSGIARDLTGLSFWTKTARAS